MRWPLVLQWWRGEKRWREEKEEPGILTAEESRDIADEAVDKARKAIPGLVKGFEAQLLLLIWKEIDARRRQGEFHALVDLPEIFHDRPEVRVEVRRIGLEAVRKKVESKGYGFEHVSSCYPASPIHVTW